MKKVGFQGFEIGTLFYTLLLTVACCSLARPALADTHYVSLSGGHVAPYTNWVAAATNIQEAIDASSDGDTVLVNDGDYSTGGHVVYGTMTNRVAIDKAITVQSVNGSAVTIRAAPPGAEYYPLKPGTKWVYDYHNEMFSNNPKFVYSNATTGKMRARVVGEETTNGVAYIVMETSYENVFNMPPQRTLFRYADDGVHMAMTIRDEFVDTRLIAFPPSAGASWDYFDGVAGQRRIASVETVEAGGKRYENCLKIVRDFKDPVKQKTLTHEDYYAPGVGLIKFRLYQNNEMGVSDTRTELISNTVP
ncbi:MAG: hypothetical protein H3C50_09925 [Kiritimatiellae bacterium]|nr:hypothetical protein [Kiritimatiellia bacterium]MCO5062722.1 hypothetical protein [Kiritimatiellia bacterium]MCO5067067.1 hypothetical protein [Kiritimatiellia bacterium]